MDHMIQTSHRFPQIQFEYKDPSPRFDRCSVKGVVVRLVRVRERESATALEVTAGGKVCEGKREEGRRGRGCAKGRGRRGRREKRRGRVRKGGGEGGGCVREEEGGGGG